uniref:Uncharacterized protein n=1 Tax=Daucus carota subsp. sativus TaxID=79200 RepID=A0A169WL77_DAUCS
MGGFSLLIEKVSLLRNSEGELIEARTVVHKMLTSPVTAEALAMDEVRSWIASRR